MGWSVTRKRKKIITNLKVKIDFNLPELRATKIMTWNYHVGESAKGRYDMILVRYILTALILNLILFYHIVEADDGLFKGSTVTPKESFMNTYTEELHESEQVHTSTKW